jgi:hypothetical protein
MCWHSPLTISLHKFRCQELWIAREIRRKARESPYDHIEGNHAFTENWKINSKNSKSHPKRWQEKTRLGFPNPTSPISAKSSQSSCLRLKRSICHRFPIPHVFPQLSRPLFEGLIEGGKMEVKKKIPSHASFRNSMEVSEIVPNSESDRISEYFPFLLEIVEDSFSICVKSYILYSFAISRYSAQGLFVSCPLHTQSFKFLPPLTSHSHISHPVIDI